MATGYEFHTINVKDTEFTVPVDYTNLEPIGRGVQNTVCSALDTLKDQRVAIKKLSNSFQNVIYAKRTYRDIKLLKLVNHKNIIRLLGVFTPDKRLEDFKDVYLVTELMRGSCNIIDRRKLNHDKFSYLMYQILCGIGYLHKSGIIHRDLKPSNIAVSSDCTLKIIDFGLARKTSVGITEMRPYYITIYYQAPEVLMDMSYEENVDVWSVGCIFAEILTGEVLFRCCDNLSQLSTIINRLGSPPQSFYDKLLAAKSKYAETLPHYDGHSFKELFPDDLFKNYHTEGTENGNIEFRDLLSKMLKIDADERISVKDAFAHNYVKRWYKEEEANPSPSVIHDATLDKNERKLEEWKKLIFEEIATSDE